MTGQPVRVLTRPGSTPCAWVDPDLLATPDGRKVQGIAVGSRKVEASVRAGDPGTVVLSTRLARALLLPVSGGGRRLRARWEDGYLRLGPLVGVLTWWRRRNPPFGADTPLVASMSRLANKQAILLYAFTPAGLDRRHHRVRGHLYDSAQARWQRQWLPLPDAAYDRLTSRRVANARRTRGARRYLESRLEGRFFNRAFWDKWMVHRALAQDPAWQRLLPETAPYQGAGQLRRWLERYATVWLKPRQGTQGIGILVARRLRDGRIAIRRASGGAATRVVRSTAQLARAVAALKRPGAYIIQEGLRLGRAWGRPFDVRILVQKDGTGTWRSTKVFARVAAPGSLVANISAGGTGVRIARALAGAPRSLRSKAAAIRTRIQQLAAELPPVLEQALGGPIGEVGLDLGIETSGRIRFLEANAKPFRLASTRTGSARLVRLSLLRPVLYAAYLAGFSTTEKDGGSDSWIKDGSDAG